MNEFERLQQMYHQEFILKKKDIKFKANWRKWQIARKRIEAVMETIPESKEKLIAALKLSIAALTKMVSIEDNPPLNRTHLNQMDGEPVWVVSYDRNGRWGLVDTSDKSVIFYSEEGFYKEHWFDGRYIFKYKKEIVDHTEELERHGISGEVDSEELKSVT